MNNTITPTNNINFKAKLDISNIRGNNARWESIAKIFEAKTRTHQTDVVILKGSFKRGFDFNVIENGEKTYQEATIFPKAGAKLNKLMNNDVAHNLADIFYFLKRQDHGVAKQRRLAETLKLDKLDKAQGLTLTEQFCDFMYNVCVAKQNEFIAKHPIFKNNGIAM